MPKIKLTKEMVVEIKNRLLNGETHQSLANEFNVSRPLISKINKSLIDPDHRDARWVHVNRGENTSNQFHIPLVLRKIIQKLSNESAGDLLKTMIDEKYGK